MNIAEEEEEEKVAFVFCNEEGERGVRPDIDPPEICDLRRRLV